MTGLFARHTGRHCRHGSWTGWSALAPVVALVPVVEGFSRPRASRPRTAPVPLGVFPMAADPFLFPYSPKDAA